MNFVYSYKFNNFANVEVKKMFLILFMFIEHFLPVLELFFILKGNSPRQKRQKRSQQALQIFQLISNKMQETRLEKFQQLRLRSYTCQNLPRHIFPNFRDLMSSNAFNMPRLLALIFITYALFSVIHNSAKHQL